ncbi:hypothetical protein H4582DRAFT_2101619 [Lactarius indigo]|nr:hypothetical protein H4582DRAFT_2101619 [Lactarius indigo]
MSSLNEFECWDGSNTECLVKRYLRKPQLPLFCSGVKDEKRHLSYQPLKQSTIWNACAIILTPDVLDQLTDKTRFTVSDIRQVYAATRGQDRKRRQITTKRLAEPTTVPSWLTNRRMTVKSRLSSRTSDLLDRTVHFFGQYVDFDHSRLHVSQAALCLDTDGLDRFSRRRRSRTLSTVQQSYCTLGSLGRQQLFTSRYTEPVRPLTQAANPLFYATKHATTLSILLNIAHSCPIHRQTDASWCDTDTTLTQFDDREETPIIDCLPPLPSPINHNHYAHDRELFAPIHVLDRWRRLFVDTRCPVIILANLLCHPLDTSYQHPSVPRPPSWDRGRSPSEEGGNSVAS